MPTSTDMLMIAERLADEQPSDWRLREWLRDAQEDFGVNSATVEKLLDRRRWRVARPRIIIQPSINQVGNLQVMWRPTIGEYEARSPEDFEFDTLFLGRVVNATDPYGSQRPMGELQWFRNIPRRIPPKARPAERTAAMTIAAGIKARYDEMIAHIRGNLDVTAMASMEFDVGSDGRIAWSLEAVPVDRVAPSSLISLGAVPNGQGGDDDH